MDNDTLTRVLDNRIETLNMKSKRRYVYRHLNGYWGIYLSEGSSLSTVVTGLDSRRKLLNVLDGMINYAVFEELALNGQIVSV